MTLKKVATFWGSIVVPSHFGTPYCETLGYIAWKDGVNEDKFQSRFTRWFRAQAEKHPELLRVHVHQLYPIDEFQFLGQYETCSSETAAAAWTAAQKPVRERKMRSKRAPEG